MNEQEWAVMVSGPVEGDPEGVSLLTTGTIDIEGTLAAIITMLVYEHGMDRSTIIEVIDDILEQEVVYGQTH